jgi:short-chain Z-isoprenyl diphosphate synthase
VQALLREQAKQGEDLDTRAVPLRARPGFLLWQSAYSEFYFCDVHWPAFRRIDFLRAVRAFQQRDRRFGS